MSKKNTVLKRLISWSLINLAFSFMFCIFAPTDAYFGNVTEFWFSYNQMIPVCGIFFACAFVVLELIALAASFVAKKFKKTGDIMYIAGIVLLVIFYIQGNYIPRNYGVLNGAEIDWGSYTGYAVASIILIVAVIGIGVLLFLKARKNLDKIGRILGIALVLIQAITMSTLFLQHQENIVAQEKAIVTTKDLFNLSKDNNVIVFLLDTYDGVDMNALLENDYDNQSQIFENFTYYQNTLGGYPTTKCSLPFILTGEWYQNEEPYKDYVQKAYEDNAIYKTLADNNYELDVYTNEGYLSKNDDFYDNVEKGTYSVSDKTTFAQKLYKLVAFNYMPHQLKQFFFTDTSEFENIKSSDIKNPVYLEHVIWYKKQFENAGIDLSKSGNLFKFYHLEGVHHPNTFGKDLVEDKNAGYTSYDEAAGCNELLKMYFDALKEKGIYDSSTIVIMADHGHKDYSQNPIFFIKNANEKHEFKVSGVPMSFEFLKDIWVSFAKGETVDEAYIQRCSDAKGNRRFLFYTWDDAWSREYMPGMQEMFCEGEANIKENLVPSGQNYVALGENHEYKFGTVLDFVDGRSAYTHVLYGISYGTVGNESLMTFDLPSNKKNLEVVFNLVDHTEVQSIAIYANGNLVFEDLMEYRKDEPVKFIIPKEYIDEDGHLDLLFAKDITNKTADFTLKKSGIVIDTMVINTTSKEFDLDSQRITLDYDFGTPLYFTLEDTSGIPYAVNGFYSPESWGTWTCGYQSTLRFDVADTSKPLNLQLHYHIFDEQNINIYANGILIDSFKAVDDPATRDIVIPVECLTSTTLMVTFEFPDAHQPNERDGRIIALGFRALCLTQIEE